VAKQGQHHNDAVDSSKPRGHERSRGRNNPSQSQTTTTGSPKKKETYRKQAVQHENPHDPAQAAKNNWNDDIRDEPTIEGSTRDRDPRSRRSGSDSNASAGSRGQ
jgi:hypothetical protein